MAEFKVGDRVKVEFGGVVYLTGCAYNTVAVTPDEEIEKSDFYFIDKKHIKRIGKTVRPNQVWERDGERFYVRVNTGYEIEQGYNSGVDLIQFTTNRRAFHLPFGSSNSLEDEGFELVLDVKEDKS